MRVRLCTPAVSVDLSVPGDGYSPDVLEDLTTRAIVMVRAVEDLPTELDADDS